MKEMVDVIAVVVTHNRKRLLLRCLRAIFSQTSKVTKVIVVDNASSGYCPEAGFSMANG